MQGLNVRIDIYQRAQQADDAVGGSVRDDVVRYQNVRARISNARPQQLLLQQGYVVKNIHEIIVYPDRYPAIREEDIVIPLSGQWTGARLRVVAVQRSSLRPGEARSHIQLFCERERYAQENVEETP